MAALERERDHSRLRMMQTLLHRRSLSRAELSETLGLSRATVAGLVHELELAGVVAQQPDETGEGRRGIGRPPLQVLLSPRAAFAIGLDLGHERVSAAMCDLAGEVLVTRTAELPARREPRVVLELAERLTLEVLAEARVDISKVLGVGVGLAAPVGSASGEIYAAHILPGWNDVRPAELLERRLGLPVRIDNDANVGAMGEYLFGAGRGHQQVLYVRLSTGVGLGLILDGRLHRGVSGVAGELGHVPVVAGGLMCRCGSRGCLETIASPVAIAELLERSRLEPISVSRMLELVRSGDRGAVRAVADAGTALGKAIAATVNLLNPELVIIGGELAGAGEALLQPVREVIARQAVAPAARSLRVVAGELADQAEVRGAAAIQLSLAPYTLASRLAESSVLAA